jgi:hypothetical protein
VFEYTSAAGIPLAKPESEKMTSPCLHLDLSTHYYRDGHTIMYPQLDNQELEAVNQAVRQLCYDCEHYQYWLTDLTVSPGEKLIRFSVKGKINLHTNRVLVLTDTHHDAPVVTDFQLPRGATTEMIIREIMEIGNHAGTEARESIMGQPFMSGWSLVKLPDE